MVDISTHAKLRWLQRTDAWHMSPAEAWRDGEPADLDWISGRARYHSQTGTYIVAHGEKVTTVLDATHVERASSQEVPA